jgi:hypothetical protein
MEGYNTAYLFCFGEYRMVERARDKYREVQSVKTFSYHLRAENHMMARFSVQHVQVSISSPVPMRTFLPDSAGALAHAQAAMAWEQR